MKPTLIYLALALSLLTTGCGRPTKFSTIVDGGFDPIGEFRKHGYVLQTQTLGEGLQNAKMGYAWKSWCGILSRPGGSATCEDVATVLRDELNRTLGTGSLDELTVRTRRASESMTGMLRYNKDAVHGDMQVWLTPLPSNEAVSYVIFVREDRLK